MSEIIRNTNFEKFLNKLKKTISKLLSHNMLMPILVEISDRKVRLYVYEGMDRLTLKRLYCTDYTTLLISHFTSKGINEPNEFEMPFSINYRVGSCYYLIGNEELEKL